MPLSKQQREFYRIFSRHGSGDALVEITPREVALLVHIAHADLHRRPASWMCSAYCALLATGLYALTPRDIGNLPDISEEEAFRYLEAAKATDANDLIFLYLKNLSELYRRRFKFYNIMRVQPFPSPEQIGPRCLLEFGNCSDDLLFTWMAWRKFMYDVDNRSAQETGYLFEPILASCLGGESVSHRNSPVKRVDGNGRQTSEGRQVDCYIRDASEVYELKLRVSIAASGQGRIDEELSFPYEARVAGLKPILVVFDSTPSPLLEKLSAEYTRHGGSVAIGEAAWAKLAERAGKGMEVFIAKYIKPPIQKMRQWQRVLPADILLSASSRGMSISSGTGDSYTIPREDDVR